ncbi:MAG TPA: RNA 2',3'-cyclic phosphodiesterase [Solirubrobacteraceae bacterium]|jgi:2'-5' RNA ligase
MDRCRDERAGFGHEKGIAYPEPVTHGATARLFVAVDPPEEVCRRLAEWARAAVREASASAREQAAPRVLDPELLHVTLCFLGSRPVGEIEPIGEQLAACGVPVGELSVGAPLWLPPRRPRALAVEIHDEEEKLARLQADVVKALGDLLPDAQETTSSKRRFRAHITVARMSRGVAPRKRALPPTPALSFVPTELILYRSWLSPDGASYEALARHPVG